MKKYFQKLIKKSFIFTLLLLFFCASVNAQAEIDIEFQLKFKLPGTSIRAIEVTQNNTLWFAGNRGRYGRIINERLEMDSISHEGRYPEFRSIAFNGKHIFLLSIENPALLYKIDPARPLGTYELVYKETHPKVFYDSMAFIDSKNGIAMGDPTEDCLSVIKTTDGGNSWTKMLCSKMPKAVDGEAAFAASNSNLATFDSKVWMVTGGTKARVFISEDRGENWRVNDTPIVQGGKMTGIFTVAFYDGQSGIVMGGNWEDKKNDRASKAITTNGGSSWELIAQNQFPGYISCVKYVPKGQGKNIIAVSTEGIFYSKDQAKNWYKVSDNGYYTIRFIDQQTAWLSKNEEIAKIKLK